jgi:predicted DNA-binding transcriptional regulator AlpA
MLNGPEPEVLTASAPLAALSRRLRQSIYDLMRRDPLFPKRRQIGSEFSVGWLRGEVMEWLSSRPRVEFNDLDTVARRKSSRTARTPAHAPELLANSG